MQINPRAARLSAALLTLALMAGPASARHGKSVTGSGHASTETLDFTGLRGVVNTTFGDLEVRQGDEDRLAVTLDDNLHQYLDCKVEDGILTLRFRRGIRVSSRSSLHFALTVKRIEELGLSGSGKVRAEALSGSDLSLHLSGSGNMELASLQGRRLALRLSGSGNITVKSLEAESVETRLSGSGNVVLRGEVEEQQLRLSGSGDYRGEGLASQQAQVRNTGSGDSRLDVSDRLEVSISGSGDVRYAGKPHVATRHLSGSGSLRQL